jgi:hypothetical protein
MPVVLPQNRNLTEGQPLVFAYDFGITIAMLLPTAMVLASVLMRGNHPLENIQNGRC